jgi:hypothetical protein
MRHASIVVGALLCACGGGLRLTSVESAYRQPSNVAVYFTVDSGDGEPVPGLTAEDFRIYEDERLVSTAESQQTIVNPEVAAEHYTLVLVDMSGSVSESDQVPLIEAAVQEFTSQLESHQRVGIYAFDGEEDIHRITPFTGSAGSVAAGAGRLSNFRPQDPSTNLHGAVVHALEELDEAMSHSSVPLRFGTLVVFTDGTDHASRVSAQDMRRSIDESQHDVFAIGVGDEIDDGVLGDIGREGYVSVEDQAAISEAFRGIAERILRMTQRYYLLSYCSPARAGTHRVRVEATSEGAAGSLTYEFDAANFGPNCNPSTPPPFDTSQGGMGPRRRPRANHGQRLQVRVAAGANPEAGDQ